MIELFRYQSDDGREPFTEWLNTLRDKVAQAKTVVILLCGGDKSSQTADIQRAQALWSEWKRRQS